MFEKIGMSKAEIERYSFLKIIRARCDGHAVEGIEAEASAEVQKRTQRMPLGTFIPGDVLLHRTLTVAAPTGGGDTVQTSVVGFIDFLYNAMQVMKLGATPLGGLIGDLSIPKLTGKNQAYWLATESSVPTVSDMVFGAVPLTPKTCAAFSGFSRKLLLQSSIDIETLVKKSLATCLGLEIDRVCAVGDPGSNEPTGIVNWPSVGNVIMGTPDGDYPTYVKMVEFEQKVAAANALRGSLGYLMNSNVSTKLKTTQLFPLSALGIPVFQSNPDGSGVVAGYKALVSNQCPATGAKGSGTNLSTIIFGNWEDLYLGAWGGLDLLVDPFTLGVSGTVIVRVFQSVDVAIAHAGSFAYCDDAQTIAP